MSLGHAGRASTWLRASTPWTQEAFGSVNGWTGLLFSGTGTLSTNHGEDGSKPIT